ncbi:uncharacterized protein BJ171DRAFT_513272, partial [Polychytrium aggregatum]|uniref:uncharacterized protein n=1 Tax=Polychytrium aggregatum TaxID=110093 RepID=UPI0022FE650C
MSGRPQTPQPSQIPLVSPDGSSQGGKRKAQATPEVTSFFKRRNSMPDSTLRLPGGTSLRPGFELNPENFNFGPTGLDPRGSATNRVHGSKAQAAGSRENGARSRPRTDPNPAEIVDLEAREEPPNPSGSTSQARPSIDDDELFLAWLHPMDEDLDDIENDQANPASKPTQGSLTPTQPQTQTPPKQVTVTQDWRDLFWDRWDRAISTEDYRAAAQTIDVGGMNSLLWSTVTSKLQGTVECRKCKKTSNTPWKTVKHGKDEVHLRCPRKEGTTPCQGQMTAFQFWAHMRHATREFRQSFVKSYTDRFKDRFHTKCGFEVDGYDR